MTRVPQSLASSNSDSACLQKALDQFLLPETRLLLEELQAHTGARFRKLNAAIGQLIDDWSMISFTPLDYSEEDSIAYVLSQVCQLGPSLQQCLLQARHPFLLFGISRQPYCYTSVLPKSPA